MILSDLSVKQKTQHSKEWHNMVKGNIVSIGIN